MYVNNNQLNDPSFGNNKTPHHTQNKKGGAKTQPHQTKASQKYRKKTIG
jgi:hypothetical protein